MQILDLPLSALVLILFGIVAVFTLVVSIRLPPNFTKDQQLREELKKKKYSEEEPLEPLIPDKKDQVN